MFKKFIAALKNQASNDYTETRRRHPRRTSDRCVLVMEGKTYPLADWSPGGALVVGDERLFEVGKDIDFTLKFKLRNTIIDVNHRAKIIRKAPQKVALQFEPITRTIQRKFQKVMDDYAAREFANSQVG